jgi:hypothetical protein
MTLTDLLILGAAVHRLVSIWLREEIARPLREWMQRRWRWVAYLAGCPLCLSVWAAVACVALWYRGKVVGFLVVAVLAISEAAIGWDTMIALAGRIGWPPGASGRGGGPNSDLS